MVKAVRWILTIVVIFLTLQGVWTQETLVQDKAYRGRIFKAYLRTTIPYSRDLEVELELPDEEGLSLMRAPYIRAYNGLTDNEGERVYQDMVEVVLSLSAKEGGIYYCSDLRLFRENFERIVPSFPIIVHSRDEASLDYPLELFWSKVKSEIYPGETVPLILNTRYTESLDFPQSITLKKTTRGNLEQVDLAGSIESTFVRDIEVYAYPIQSWYFTATEPGEVDFPGGEVIIKGLSRDIPPLAFTVKDLPPQVQLSGAVGSFHMESSLSHQRVQPGEIVTLTLRVSGVGNFHFFNFPSVSSEGFEQINSSERESLVQTEEGWEGFREREFRFQAQKGDRGSLEVEPFFWVTPDGRVQSVGKKSLPLTIEVPEEGSTPTAQILKAEELKAVILKEKLSGPVKWFFLIPGVLFFIISLFLLKKGDVNSSLVLLVLLPLLMSMGWGEELSGRVLRAEILFEEGQYEQSLGIYRTLYEEEPHGAYLYNIGVIQSLMGEIVEGELNIRSALLSYSGDRILLRGLKGIEEKMGLEDQYSNQWEIGPQHLEWIIVIVANGLFVVLGLYFKNKRIRLLLLMSTMTLIIALSGVGVFVLTTRYSQPQGIVGSDGGNLLRVPESTAEEWLAFDPGTAVGVKIEKQGYYFIETGYGLEGWLDTSQVILVEKGNE